MTDEQWLDSFRPTEDWMFFKSFSAGSADRPAVKAYDPIGYGWFLVHHNIAVSRWWSRKRFGKLLQSLYPGRPTGILMMKMADSVPTEIMDSSRYPEITRKSGAIL